MSSTETEPLLARRPLDAVKNKESLVLIFVGLALAVFISALDETIVATSAFSIVSQFEAFGIYPWISVAYLVCLNASQPLYGKLSDIFGRRPIILFAVIVFLVGSAGCGWAPSMTVLLASRCIAGIGAGGLTGIAFVIIADLFPLEDRPKYQSILMSSYGLACVIGPVIGGVFTKRLSWRWCFWINIPVCIITIVIMAAFLHLPRPQGDARPGLKDVDFAGAFSLVAAVSCIMVPTGLGGNYWAWNSAPVITLYLGGVICLALFFLVEHRYSSNPIIPLRLLKNMNLVRAWTTLFFYGMAFFTFMFYLPVWFEVVEGSSAERTGLQLIPLLVGQVSAGLLYTKLDRLASRLPYSPLRVLVHAGCLIFILGTVLRTFVNPSTSRVIEAAGLLLLGFGGGLMLQTSFMSAQSAVDPEDLASANSLAVFSENLGGSIGLSISAAVNRMELGKRFSQIPADVLSAEALSAIEHNPSLVRDPGFLSDMAREVVIEQFVGSIGLAFKASVAFAVLAYITVLVFKHRA
ncbi:hypothetical protein BOTBODRAFT_175262 [Botryobasidium botryosum FD-172 SS1]|uniref:Major facilitator superfamily (MFS) profile domain-containing protein n=1 Tax=Botryobasidium botryosum (strain FD-172 SS1) TaxID=930990 RepID=A0A067MDN7_BOTB1|nr:hypothetical protein BOTBODRAFT_175262 [Botryobasidium botryosum FD-172 SS1]